MSEPIAVLRKFLEALPAGPVVDTKTLINLLFSCWQDFRGHDQTRMRSGKLLRIEEPRWKSPILSFLIERHGETVMGSSRATVYTWTLDMIAQTAVAEATNRRQLGATDKRLDVNPIAESLANAIIAGKPDERLKITKLGHVVVKMALAIPATNKQTTAARRKRLRQKIDTLLAGAGWESVRPNTYFRRQAL